MLNNLRALHQVMRDVKLPRSELDSLIYKRLKRVLISAYQHVPYYRELMQNIGYNPIQEYRGPEDLGKLPITTKNTFKKNVAALIKEGSDLSQCYKDSTSGSTGIPLEIYQTPYEHTLQIAKWLRVLFINGYSVFDKVMSFTSPRRLKEGQSILQHLGILRRLPVDYRLSPGEMTDIFFRYKPHVLYGNRAQLDLVALELARRGIRPENLKLLLGGAEIIHERNRQLYRDSFGVEMIEFYGAVEMAGNMAYETPAHDGLHLNEDLIYFEFLDKAGKPVSPGQQGRIVMTDLSRTLMPFIRYDQGDLIVFQNREDKYGDMVRRIVQIVGRDEDYLVMPDGTQRAFHDFYEIMHNYHDIKQFRIVQKKYDLFRILIVADSDYFHSIQDDLKERFQNTFLLPVTFEFVNVEHLAPDPSGKFKRIISEIRYSNPT